MDLASQNYKMWDLRNDRFTIVFDKSIESIMDNIDFVSLFKDGSFNDDIYVGPFYIKEKYPFEWAILNNFWTSVLSSYVSPQFPDKTLRLAEIKLAEGLSNGNYNWHTDKHGEYNNNSGSPSCDQDIICLYYFNDTDFGPLCLKYNDRKGLYKVYPQKGMIVIINEYDEGLIHKIEYYKGQEKKRYVARVSFKVE